MPQGLGAVGGRSRRGPASESDHICSPSDGSSVTSGWWLAVGPGIYTADMGRGCERGLSFWLSRSGRRGGREERAARGSGVCEPARQPSVLGAVLLSSGWGRFMVFIRFSKAFRPRQGEAAARCPRGPRQPSASALLPAAWPLPEPGTARPSRAGTFRPGNREPCR